MDSLSHTVPMRMASPRYLEFRSGSRIYDHTREATAPRNLHDDSNAIRDHVTITLDERSVYQRKWYKQLVVFG